MSHISDYYAAFKTAKHKVLSREDESLLVDQVLSSRKAYLDSLFLDDKIVKKAILDLKAKSKLYVKTSEIFATTRFKELGLSGTPVNQLKQFIVNLTGQDLAYLREQLISNITFTDRYAAKLHTKFGSTDACNKLFRKYEVYRSKLIESQQYYVLNVTRRFTSSNRNLITHWEDLVQEGQFGLIAGIEHFDTSHKFKFNTYADFWVFHSIERFISDRFNTIRLPVRVLETRNKINKVSAKHYRLNGSYPTYEELLTTYKFPKYCLDSMTSFTKTISGDEVDEYGKSFFDECDSHCLTPEQILENNEMKVAVSKTVNTLNAREKRLVEDLFGLSSSSKGEPVTYAVMGRRNSISRTRAQQVCNRATNVLRVNGSHKLAEFR